MDVVHFPQQLAAEVFHVLRLAIFNNVFLVDHQSSLQDMGNPDPRERGFFLLLSPARCD
jgi:hypothetical protein